MLGFLPRPYISNLLELYPHGGWYMKYNERARVALLDTVSELTLSHKKKRTYFPSRKLAWLAWLAWLAAVGLALARSLLASLGRQTLVPISSRRSLGFAVKSFWGGTPRPLSRPKENSQQN